MLGWVSYATSAINSAVGENKLMPDADTPCCIINGKNGNVRSNGSWILGRMVRDYEYWMDHRVRERTENVLNERWEIDKKIAESKFPGSGEGVSRPNQAGLVVSFWKPSHTKEAGKAVPDILYWSGIVVSFLQLGIASIPYGRDGDWSVILVTAAAIALCLAQGSLRQWRVEKWACRRLDGRSKKNFVLTRGNGAQHAIVILSEGRGLDLEDLATGFENLDAPSIMVFARVAAVVLGLCWILLLITSSALAADAWFLMAIGGTGMMQNIFVAGWSRKPEALGVPLDFHGVMGEKKVMETLLKVESEYENLGRSMLSTFFQGDLRDDEKAQWDALKREQKDREKGAKMIQ